MQKSAKKISEFELMPYLHFDTNGIPYILNFSSQLNLIVPSKGVGWTLVNYAYSKCKSV
jgi:hypothetical protein